MVVPLPGPTDVNTPPLPLKWWLFDYVSYSQDIAIHMQYQNTSKIHHSRCKAVLNIKRLFKVVARVEISTQTCKPGLEKKLKLGEKLKPRIYAL